MDLTIFVRYRFGTTGAAGVDAEANVVVAIDNDSTLLNPYPWILEKIPKTGNIQERHSWENIQGKFLPMMTSRA